MEVKRVSNMSFYNLAIRGEYIIVDIRDEERFQIDHIQEAANLYHDLNFQEFLVDLSPDNHQVVLLYGDEHMSEQLEDTIANFEKLTYVYNLFILESGYDSFKSQYPFLITQKGAPLLLYPPQILPHLYLGSSYFAGIKPVMKNLNIKYILNVAVECNNVFENDPELDIVYLKCNMRDTLDPQNNILIHFGNCFSFLERAKNENSNVFVHCAAGVSRSAAVVVAYLMKYYKLSLQDSLSCVKEMRPVANPNPHFLNLLRLYGNSLQEYYY